MDKYLVNGATGNIGRYVVQELLALNKKVVAAVRDAEKSKSLFKEDSNLNLIEFDFLNKESFAKALDGVSAVFLVRPPNLADPKNDMVPFLKAVKAKGISKIVFVSLLGVEKNPIVPHRKIEDAIKNLNIPYVFLRPSFFMQNLTSNHQDEIKERDEIYIPAGRARTSFIDTRDIATAAANTLINKKYKNESFTLTGKEAIDYYEVALILSKVLGREIIYKNPSLMKFRKDRIQRGTPQEFANVMTLLYLMTKLNTAKKVTSDLEMLIKKEPISFSQFASDHSHYWQKVGETKWVF